MTIHPPEREMLRPCTAAAVYDMSRRTFDRLASDPEFPEPIRLNKRLVLFKRSELDAYFDRKRGGNREVCHA